MFAPKGFTNIFQIYDAFMHHRLQDTLRATRELASGIETHQEMLRVFQRIAPADWVEEAVFYSISDNMFIYSPGGELLKLDMRSLRSHAAGGDFIWLDFEDAVKRHPDLGPIPPEFRHAYLVDDFPPDEFEDDYRKHIKKRGNEGHTPWDFSEVLGMERLHRTVPLFYERRYFTITLKSFDFIDQFNFMESDDFRDTARILRPFEGWAMCVETEFAESEDLQQLARLKMHDGQQLSQNSGRPAHLREALRDSYLRLYPNGHVGTPWLVVLREVNADAGTNASLDTLRRAVKEAERKEIDCKT